MKSLIFIQFMMGPLLLIIALLTKVFPPGKISWFYGYRTRRSMQSQEAWVEANTYCSNAMVILGIGVSFFQLIGSWLLELETSLLLSAILLVTGLFVMIFLTEQHLKKKGFN